MPETRKHRVQARDELDRALFAALGEPVRPATPGASATPAADQPPAQTASTPTTGRPLGTFTFGARKPGDAETER